MDIVLNGQRRSVPEQTDLATVLAELGTPTDGVAVALDGAVVPRGAWSTTVLGPEAVVEVLTGMQGG